MRIGVFFYALATVATGILDLVWGKFEASHQPFSSLGQDIPGQQVLACIAGVWLVAAGMAILWRKTARIGALQSAMIYLVFALFWVARLYALTHSLGLRLGVIVFVLGGLAAQMLLVAPAAIVHAATALADPVWRERAVVAARWMLGLPPIASGLGHLINLHAYERFFPHWLPFGSFWIVLTGVAFLLAGSAIASSIRDVLAARLLAMMLLVFEAIVEIPPVFIRPQSQEAWGGAVYNLTAIGACLLFAEFFGSRRQADRREVFVAEQVPASAPSSVAV